NPPCDPVPGLSDRPPTGERQGILGASSEWCGVSTRSGEFPGKGRITRLVAGSPGRGEAIGPPTGGESEADRHPRPWSAPGADDTINRFPVTQEIPASSSGLLVGPGELLLALLSPPAPQFPPGHGTLRPEDLMRLLGDHHRVT